MVAAERLFLQKGLDQTAVEEITRAADVAKGTFYLHFSSKADVVQALRDRFVEGLLDRIVSEVAQQDGQDWRGKLEVWAKACSAGYIDAARLHHLVFVAAPPPTRDGLGRNRLIDHLENLLDQGAALDAWAVDDPHFTAVFLFNALHGVVHQADATETVDGHRRLLDAVARHFLRTLGLTGVAE